MSEPDQCKTSSASGDDEYESQLPLQFACPSAEHDDPQAVILGVVRREEGTDRVQILRQTLPPDALTGHVPSSLRPTEVLRFAAPCAEHACRHFDGERCQL